MIRTLALLALLALPGCVRDAAGNLVPSPGAQKFYSYAYCVGGDLAGIGLALVTTEHAAIDASDPGQGAAQLELGLLGARRLLELPGCVRAAALTLHLAGACCPPHPNPESTQGKEHG